MESNKDYCDKLKARYNELCTKQGALLDEDPSEKGIIPQALSPEETKELEDVRLELEHKCSVLLTDREKKFLKTGLLPLDVSRNNDYTLRQPQVLSVNELLRELSTLGKARASQESVRNRCQT